MRVSHLLETTDLSQLSKWWKSTAFQAVLASLRALGEDEDMLADIQANACAKHADSSPELVFNYLTPLMDVLGSATSHKIADYKRALGSFLNGLVEVVLNVDPELIKKLSAKVDPDRLLSYLYPTVAAKLKLAGWKVNRSVKQKKVDDEHQQYVFIGRPTFKDTGDGSFKKTLEIENLVPVDRFDQGHHKMIAMMKIRARFQGENSEVYTVTLPKDALSSMLDNGKVPDWLADLIDKHKTQVRS